MKNKKYWLYTGAIVAIIIFCIFFNNNVTNENKRDTILIGASLPLSGPSASLGERVKNAMEIALGEINKTAFRPIKLVYEDDKGDAQTAVSIANKFIHSDNIHIIIGPLKSDPLLADAPITESNKVILFSPTAGAKTITSAGDFVFRNIENPDVHGQKASDFFLNQNIHNVALFTAKASNAQSYSDAFKNSFENANNTIVSSASYLPDTTDFRAFVLEAIQAHATGVYIGVATPKDAGILIKQMRDLQLNVPTVISPAGEASELITIAGTAAEGVYVTAAPFHPEDAAAVSFANAYAKLHGKTADGFAANGYDALKIIYAAISACGGDTKTECIRDYMYNLKDYPGAGGKTTFDKNGDVIKNVQIKVIKGGKFISLN